MDSPEAKRERHDEEPLDPDEPERMLQALIDAIFNKPDVSDITALELLIYLQIFYRYPMHHFEPGPGLLMNIYLPEFPDDAIGYMIYQSLRGDE